MSHRTTPIHGTNRIILIYAARGYTDAAIAAELKLTPEAIRQAIHRVCTQLGTDRQGAIERWREGAL